MAQLTNLIGQKEVLENIGKVIKKLIKHKEISLEVFTKKICPLCPHTCGYGSFCLHMVNKFGSINKYSAIMDIFEVLVSAYYKQLYIQTFYFLKENICSICKKYGVGCYPIEVYNICPSKYIYQMEGNIYETNKYLKGDKYDIPVTNKCWYDEDTSDCWDGYKNDTSYKSFSDIETTPMLSMIGTKMIDRINNLYINKNKTENKNG